MHQERDGVLHKKHLMEGRIVDGVCVVTEMPKIECWVLNETLGGERCCSWKTEQNSLDAHNIQDL